MKTSIYTSLFNYSPDKFDLEEAFNNWSKYGDEIVVATFEDQMEEISKVIIPVATKRVRFGRNVKVVPCKDTSLEDPLFDGKLKNAALQACSNEVVIQVDADERISGDVEEWEKSKRVLFENSFSPVARMICVIDLYGDLNHYKSINMKWYLHLKTGTKRGRVWFAERSNGSTDITKSDSCELVSEHNELIPCTADRRFIDTMDIKYPLIVHLGYLDLEKRIENNKFWGPVWSKRDGSEVKVATTIEELEGENKAIPHNFGERWWI